MILKSLGWSSSTNSEEENKHKFNIFGQ